MMSYRSELMNAVTIRKPNSKYLIPSLITHHSSTLQPFNPSNPSHPNILIPQFRPGPDKILHHLNTFLVIYNGHVHSVLLQQVFSAEESAVLANDHPWDLVQ